jgi:phosphohistidine phosphatase
MEKESPTAQIILWRHATAEEGRDDLARPLTPHGHKQADRAGRWLNDHLPANARVLVSPAIRAQQTAAALKRKFDIEPRITPGSSTNQVLLAAAWPSVPCTLIVGHQPTLGQLAALLITGKESAWSVRKGAIWWIWMRPGHARPTLRAVIDPALL